MARNDSKATAAADPFAGWTEGDSTAVVEGSSNFSVNKESGVARVLFNPATGQLAVILNATDPRVVNSKASTGTPGCTLNLKAVPVPGYGTVNVNGFWTLKREGAPVAERMSDGALKLPEGVSGKARR